MNRYTLMPEATNGANVALSAHRGVDIVGLVEDHTGIRMYKRLSFAEQLALRLLCALALLFVGFVHRPMIIDIGQNSPNEIVQFALPDGTLPTLCISFKRGEDGNGHQNGMSGCEACRLTATALLPTPADTTGEPIFRAIEGRTERSTDSFYRQVFPSNTSARGPPSGSIA